jgi:hypothetical protein
MISEPAVGKVFFGRDDILRVLEKRANALLSGYRQNVALTGQMLSGKSSILYQFLYTLKDASLIPLYIEVIEEPFPSFADKFIATLLHGYLVSCGHESPKELPGLIKASEQFIPRTIYAVKKVKTELSRKNYNDAYRKLLNLTSILKQETGKSCVVILDEFHNLEFFKIRKPYLLFGKIMMIQKDTMYIVSSSQKSTIKKILSEKLALLYGNFEIIELSGFDNKTAGDFIKDKLQNIALPARYMGYLIEFTGGNPFYLDVISKKMAEIANSRRVGLIDEEIIVEAFTSSLYNPSGTINQYFTNNIMSLLEKSLREDYLGILIALACGCNKLKEIAKWFKKKSPSGFAGKLERLVEMDMIYKNGLFYEVQDRVFEFWLKTVHYRKRSSLVDDIVTRANEFKKESGHDIAAYLGENQKNITERVRELFLSFGGETVEIKKRNRKLPRFVRIEARGYGKCEDLLSYRQSGKYWVCEICRNKIDESAISDFIERYYPARESVARKLCIALEGIDRNALLLAKEKNIWIWGPENVASLLRLYKRRRLTCK